ncbi:hypothetical protein WR25_12603 isoform H [Diploscapter pachys]|uniref:Triacylglycerol lipase n=2 Tax=Diploscapter pachys TaxID=2018661 RepID=A0A2A2KNN4_9BILA|nr:hypothetical protein WR25_12603 isoform G [Diploscapter pachys]PAV75611.1 hypothetical protein WR25_12603 isoform H [Diploscapter pachys]
MIGNLVSLILWKRFENSVKTIIWALISATFAQLALCVLPDLGVPNYSCPGDLMKPSKSVPTNVNSVRPADIKLVMNLGDSLSAGNGAGAPQGDPLAVILQYRGLACWGGGEKTLEQHVTIPNILKKYNPNLFGYAVGIGSPNVWEIAQLNVAMPGAKADDLPRQARQLVALLQQHTEKVNMNDDWKLLNIFIGGNDMCGYCSDPTLAPSICVSHIQEAIRIIYDNVPRVIVSLTGMLQLQVLRQTDATKAFCKDLHAGIGECPCEGHPEFNNTFIQGSCIEYAMDELDLSNSQTFDKDDFTLVTQPFMQYMDTPPLFPNGTINMGFFAPDCFHFSQWGHAVVSTWLWKNMMEPVGHKTMQGSISTPALPLACPDSNCPFIRTNLNSRDCSKSELADLGVPNYSCPGDLMKPSKTIPTNVNSVRPADIKVVMNLGDSLSAGNGAGAPQDDPLAVVLQYRGLACWGGGDKTLDEHASISNILKKYNPNLFGYSMGIGSPNVWEIAQLNVAMPEAFFVRIGHT